MRKNKYYEKEKAIIRVKDELHKNWQDQRNQAWVELDKPIPHGYNGEWVLRDDITRSPEAEVLQWIIDNLGVEVWSKRKDFRVKEWRKNNKKWQDLKPHFRFIDESTYHSYPAVLQKYFRLDTSDKNYWWRPKYKVDIESWKLVLKKSRSYITHYREHDEILHQIEAELDKELYRLTPKPYDAYSCPKWWRNVERRKAKGKQRKENREIINTFNNGELEDDYYSTYKTKGMYWWW
jgi:hypothetical protein